MNLGDVPAWVSILAALTTSVFAIVYARGARDQARRQADEMAESNRLAAQANKLARRALDIAEATSKTTVVWQLQRISDQQYVLTNVGTGTGYEVHIEYAGFLEVRSDTEQVPPQGQVRFSAFATTGGIDPTMTVSYSVEPSGQRFECRIR